jgi:hypothetical protein
MPSYFACSFRVILFRKSQQMGISTARLKSVRGAICLNPLLGEPKPLDRFTKADWEELASRLERAGGDIEKFNARLETLEPQARTFGEAMAQALEEIYPAAEGAASASGAAAAVVAEEGGVAVLAP